MFRSYYKSSQISKIFFSSPRFSKMSSSSGPVEDAICRQLESRFNPIHLEIINESYMHNVPKGSESHFKVIVVSDQFTGVSLIQRHRMVNETLKEELATTVHALSISAKTPAQWKENPSIPTSPPCRGGAGL